MERNTCSTWHAQLFYRKKIFSSFYYCNISFASCRDLIFTSEVALFKLQQIKAYFIKHPEAPKPEILEQVTRSRYSAFCCLTVTVSNLGRGQRIHRDKGICFFWFPFSGRHCTQAKQSMSIQRRNPLWIWLCPYKTRCWMQTQSGVSNYIFSLNSWAAVYRLEMQISIYTK